MEDLFLCNPVIMYNWAKSRACCQKRFCGGPRYIWVAVVVVFLKNNASFHHIAHILHTLPNWVQLVFAWRNETHRFYNKIEQTDAARS